MRVFSLSAVALACAAGPVLAGVDWPDLDLGEPTYQGGHGQSLKKSRSKDQQCRVDQPEQLLRQSWAAVIDEMLRSEDSTDEIANTVRSQFAKLHRMRTNQRVGIFDSGVGGLTVYRRFKERFPEVNVTYLADDQRAPYGPQPPEDVADYSRHIISWLDGEDNGLTLIACNTASVASIAFGVPEDTAFTAHPVLPIAAPYGAFFRAVDKLPCRKVGLFATDATCRSGVYQRQVRSAGGRGFGIVPNNLHEDFPSQAPTRDCIGCAECVAAVQHEPPFDQDETWEERTEAMLRKKFESYLDEDGSKIDFLIFGCTHFPTLAPLVRKIFGPSLLLIDPADYQVELASRFQLRNASGITSLTVSGVPKSRKLQFFQQAARSIFSSFLKMAEATWNVVNFVPTLRV